MHIDTARQVKGELRELLPGLLAAAHAAGRPAAVAVGLCPSRGGYGIAVRHSGVPEVAYELTRHARRLAGADCDIRDIGTVRPQQWTVDQLRSRVRPLHPGLSVAHTAVTAGTIGGFVRPLDAEQPLHLLSNNHVVADSDRAQLGDPVLQPGPADGGQPDEDRIGVLARTVPMAADRPNLVDAATAVLDDGIAVEPTHPAGLLAGWVDADVGFEVEKVGRTTGLTRGRVTAIELDGLTVLYPVGLITFDGQVEVAGGGTGPFSAGGDSGSVVYDPAGVAAVGLLFAGSERGGPGGYGLTYCNPIGAVLDALAVRLGPGPDVADEEDVSLDDVRAAKRALTARLAGDPRVSGVGITRSHGRYAVRVNVVDESDVPALPASVDGVTVRVVASGRITPQPRPRP